MLSPKVESDELEMKELDSWLNRVLGGDGEGESGSSTVPSSLRSPVTYSSFVDTYGTEERASLVRGNIHAEVNELWLRMILCLPLQL